jgi:hypothetical protein
MCGDPVKRAQAEVSEEELEGVAGGAVPERGVGVTPSLFGIVPEIIP